MGYRVIQSHLFFSASSNIDFPASFTKAITFNLRLQWGKGSSLIWLRKAGIYQLTFQPLFFSQGCNAGGGNFTVKYLGQGLETVSVVQCFFCRDCSGVQVLCPGSCLDCAVEVLCYTLVSWKPTCCFPPWSFPASPGPFLALFHSLIFPYPHWSSTGDKTSVWWDPYAASHAFTYGPRTPSSCICPSS